MNALLGNVEEAEKWLAELDKRSDAPANTSLPGMRLFARAVTDLRAGRATDALRALSDDWAASEAVLTGEVVRPLRVVRAFALASDGPRSAGVAATVLTAARPAYPGEYDFLGVAWPEMAAFLVSHELQR